MLDRAKAHVRQQFVGYLALFVALGSTSAYAAHEMIDSSDIVDDSISSADIRNEAIKARDIDDGQVTTGRIRRDAVRSDRVRDDSLTGDDILESSLGTVPGADTLDGQDSADFASSGHGHDGSYYPKTESDSRYGRLDAAQTWGDTQAFDRGLKLNSRSVIGPYYTMSVLDTAIFHSAQASDDYVELPCATTAGAGRIAVVKKTNVEYPLYIAGCPPGIERVDGQNLVALPQGSKGSLIVMSTGTSSGWVIVGSHGLG